MLGIGKGGGWLSLYLHLLSILSVRPANSGLFIYELIRLFIRLVVALIPYIAFSGLAYRPFIL